MKKERIQPSLLHILRCWIWEHVFFFFLVVPVTLQASSDGGGIKCPQGSSRTDCVLRTSKVVVANSMELPRDLGNSVSSPPPKSNPTTGNHLKRTHKL